MRSRARASAAKARRSPRWLRSGGRTSPLPQRRRRSAQGPTSPPGVRPWIAKSTTTPGQGSSQACGRPRCRHGVATVPYWNSRAISRNVCARVDSNHHGENSPQGPQPSPRARTCFQQRPDRPNTAVSPTHRTHLEQRLLPTCCHARVAATLRSRCVGRRGLFCSCPVLR